MIKDKSEKTGPIEIDLTGPDGNAYVLLAISKRLASALGMHWDKIRNDMTSGDYEHLLEVMEKNFGDHIIMYR